VVTPVAKNGAFTGHLGGARGSVAFLRGPTPGSEEAKARAHGFIKYFSGGPPPDDWPVYEPEGHADLLAGLREGPITCVESGYEVGGAPSYSSDHYAYGGRTRGRAKRYDHAAYKAQLEYEEAQRQRQLEKERTAAIEWERRGAEIAAQRQRAADINWAFEEASKQGLSFGAAYNIIAPVIERNIALRCTDMKRCAMLITFRTTTTK
jgi:hypothetical protein